MKKYERLDPGEIHKIAEEFGSDSEESKSDSEKTARVIDAGVITEEHGLRFSTSLKPESILKKTLEASTYHAREGLKDKEVNQFPDRRYRELLRRHVELTKEVLALEGIARRLPSDKRSERVLERDRDRHNLHLELLKEAEKFGKNAADVETDLLLCDGKTEFYGVDIPIIDPRGLGRGFQVGESFLYDYHCDVYDPDELIGELNLQKNPEYLELTRIAGKLSGRRTDWTNPINRERLKDLQHRIEKFLQSLKRKICWKKFMQKSRNYFPVNRRMLQTIGRLSQIFIGCVIGRIGIPQEF